MSCNDALYSKIASFSLKKEASCDTPITPDTYFKANEESISIDYAYVPTQQVAGSRMKRQGAVDGAIPAASGAVNMNIEPKTAGHFLNGMLGGVTSGVLFDVANVTNFSVGDTITNGSTGTGTVTAVIARGAYLLASGVSGDWATADTVTNSGAGSALLGTFDATVYGHYSTMPNDIDVTYSLQINYKNSAIRYSGLRFTGIDAISQEDNVLTANMSVMARFQFRQAKVTAQLTAGAGAKSIAVDCTKGLVAGDSIKVYRPSTDTFLDFSAASVETHTAGTIGTTSIAVTNLETQLEIGDLVVLAPQTASYTTEKEFIWSGGTEVQLGADLDTLATESIEELELSFTNEYDERHAATGANFEDRFTSALIQKGLDISGRFLKFYTSESFMYYYTRDVAMGLRTTMVGSEIGSTDLYYTLRIDLPEIQLVQHDTLITRDDIVNEDVPFEALYNSTDGNGASFLLINDIATY